MSPGAVVATRLVHQQPVHLAGYRAALARGWCADNLAGGGRAGQRVITANGGVLVGPFEKGAAYGSKPGLRFVIAL